MKNEKSFDEAYKKLCDCHAEVIADSESNFIKTLESQLKNALM